MVFMNNRTRQSNW